jgi:hypothetical protein
MWGGASKGREAGGGALYVRISRIDGGSVQRLPLHGQFGMNYDPDRLDKFRAVFLRWPLQQVLPLYKNRPGGAKMRRADIPASARGQRRLSKRDYAPKALRLF